MKIATMAVGATAALITGGLVWLAVREEKPATPAKQADAKPTATQPAEHPSFDHFVDATRGVTLHQQQSSAPDPTSPDPNSDGSSLWSHDSRLPGRPAPLAA